MKPLKIEFDVTPRRSGLRWVGGAGSGPARAGMVALVLALAGLSLSAWQAWAARQAWLHALAAQVPATQGARTDQRLADARPVSIRPGELAAWAELANRLNLPWSTLLTALEEATPDDVALAAIEPEAPRGTVRIVAEAPTLDPLLAYAGQLRGAPMVHAVTIARHETVGRGSGQAVRLQIQLHMRLGTETLK